MQGEGGSERGGAKPGTPVDKLSPTERREHLGRVITEHPEAAGVIVTEATKDVIASDPEKTEDVLRGASGVDAEGSQGS